MDHRSPQVLSHDTLASGARKILEKRFFSLLCSFSFHHRLYVRLGISKVKMTTNFQDSCIPSFPQRSHIFALFNFGRQKSEEEWEKFTAQDKNDSLFPRRFLSENAWVPNFYSPCINFSRKYRNINNSSYLDFPSGSRTKIVFSLLSLSRFEPASIAFLLTFRDFFRVIMHADLSVTFLPCY